MYVRTVWSGGHGPYLQLVESYRPGDAKTPRTRVLVHLGEYPTPEAALAAWPSRVDDLRRIGRNAQADKLGTRLDKLRALVEAEKGERT